VGAAFLLNQGCFLVDTEVPLSRFGQRRIHELDEHHVIDVCGVGERFVRPRGIPDEGVDPRRLEVRQNVLRGVEVKVRFDKYVTGKQRHPDGCLTVASFAGHGDLGQIDLHRFAKQTLINHFFMAAFGMQHIP